MPDQGRFKTGRRFKVVGLETQPIRSVDIGQTIINKKNSFSGGASHALKRDFVESGIGFDQALFARDDRVMELAQERKTDLHFGPDFSGHVREGVLRDACRFEPVEQGRGAVNISSKHLEPVLTPSAYMVCMPGVPGDERSGIVGKAYARIMLAMPCHIADIFKKISARGGIAYTRRISAFRLPIE